MAPSSSNKKIKEMSVDLLSALPDSILCYILSFLEMKHAAITCLLSKRWQFLWTKLPGIRFKEDCSSQMENIHKFVNRVHKTLIIYSRNNLESFEVDFRHNYDLLFASDVNVWIGFAVENKVKDVSLWLNNNPTERYHMLPQMMYSNPSWTSLDLQGCIVAPRGTIQWQSLTKLSIQLVYLKEHIFEKIFSGCPVLSSLDLAFCSGFNCLEVNSHSLHQLAIYNWDHELEISAPNIHTLKLYLSRSLILKNIKSLVTAEINIAKCYVEAANYPNSVKKLFGSIRHVKKLKLGCDCIQFVPWNALNWKHPQSTRGRLELDTSCNDKNFPGILGLLESSPDLETLAVHFKKLYYPSGNISSETGSNVDLDCELCHLKTVYFKLSGHRGFSISEVEPMLTLARILLKKAVALEKMVVSFPGFTSSSTAAFYKMTKELLSYPRFSQKAAVLLC